MTSWYEQKDTRKVKKKCQIVNILEAHSKVIIPQAIKKKKKKH